MESEKRELREEEGEGVREKERGRERKRRGRKTGWGGEDRVRERFS